MARPASAGSADPLDLYLADLLLEAPRMRPANWVPRTLVAAGVLLTVPAATLLAVQLTQRPGHRTSASPVTAREGEPAGRPRTQIVVDPQPRPHVDTRRGWRAGGTRASRGLAAISPDRAQAAATADDHTALIAALPPPMLAPGPPASAGGIASAGLITVAAPSAMTTAVGKAEPARQRTARPIGQREERQDAIDAIRTLRSQ